MIDNYLNLFIDNDYPNFIDKYLNTKTLNRIKNVTYFCGCDYTKLYSPLFLYTRFDHSLVVAHMTWHFTHDKIQTIAALLHDVGTPCFAHCIDYVFGDYINQESSEKEIIDVIKYDKELMSYLNEDGITLNNLTKLEKFPILENSSPQLCTDRLDGVLSTCYIWLHTHSLDQIKNVYDNLIVLTNEYGNPELGFKNQDIADCFVSMVAVYAKELQKNEDKYVMKYVSEVVKLAVAEKLITLNDLYEKQEKDIVNIFANNFSSWNLFASATTVTRTEAKPTGFYISFCAKKRNTIPLVNSSNHINRIDKVSKKAKRIYSELENYQDTKFAYVKTLKRL